MSEPSSSPGESTSTSSELPESFAALRAGMQIADNPALPPQIQALGQHVADSVAADLSDADKDQTGRP